MRKIKFISLLLVILLLTGCGVKEIASKTSYGVNEEAILDHFSIICNNYKIEEYSDTQKKLTISFELKNNNKEQVIVTSNEFRIYNDSEFIYSNDSFNYDMDSDDTQEVKVSFIVPELDNYKVLFYSNVVSNNVAFELGNK